MTPILHFLRSLFASLRATPEEEYLADAVDLVDLEHRLAALEQRRTPVFGV
jgi:hypothetical protein